MKRLFIATLLLLSISAYSQDCNCESNFTWLKKTFEENDAGFSYIVENKGEEAYAKHNGEYVEIVKNIENLSECIETLNEWLLFFRSGHIGLEMMLDNSADEETRMTEGPTEEDVRAQYKDWEKVDVDIKEFGKYLKSKKEPDYEGIWESGIYKIGIKKQGSDYVGFIIKADGIYWTEKQLKLKITEKDGKIATTYYMKDHSERNFDHAHLIGPNYLQMGTIDLERVKPKFEDTPEAKLHLMSTFAEKPFYQQLDDNTAFIRIPSFSHTEKKDIDKVVLDNRDKILRTPNLILDLRDNGGGSDDSFGELIPLVYTNPIRTVGMAFRSTPLNNSRMLELINNPEYGLDEESKKWAQEAYDKLSDKIGEFVSLDSNFVHISTEDTVYQYPENVAILINDGNGSTTEQFLLAAKQSRKVKLYGTTTAGVLDVSNMFWVESPCKEFKLWYCLSRSFRIPDMAIDEIGIQPDYYVDKTVPQHEWIEFVREAMNE